MFNENSIVLTIENGEKLCIRVCFSFFSTQNQLPQIIIGNGWVINHFKALLFVDLNIKKNQRPFHCVEKNRFEIFDFWSNFESFREVVISCNSLFKLNLSLENLVILK